jgi:Family of unknown function (DUF6266)
MAEYFNGVLGRFNGKVGTVVGSVWRGKNVIRSLPTRSNRPATPQQLNQQDKFKLIMAFIGTMSSLVEKSFKAYGKGMTGNNAAVSYNLQNAVSGLEAPFNISYTNVLVSRGDLPNATSVTAEAIAANTVKFSWANNGGIGKAKSTDKAILVIHCPALNHTVYVLGGNIRSALTQNLAVPEFTGETVETWLAFTTASGDTTSNSIHTGSVNIAP